MKRFPPAEAEALGYEFANSPREDPREDPRERRRIGDVHVLTLKERAQMLLDGPAGIAVETLNVLLSLVLVVIAVADSYQEDEEAADEAPTFSLFEIGCMFFFLADYSFYLFASEDRLRFVVSPIGLIDAVTILPMLISFFLVSLSVSALSMLRVARIFRMLAILRLYRIVQAYRGYDYQLAVLAFMIVALVMVAAGVFQVLEQSYYTEQGLDRLQFHQAVYFVFVTLATVGYGDISPRTAAGQAFVILLIVVIVTAVPRQINRLVELSRLQHGYMHSYSLRKRSVHYGGHVVVTGHLTPESVAAFLQEFYRPRQGRVNMDVVLLADHAPSDRLQALLLNVHYRRRATFLKGSLLHDKDSRRAHVEKAAAVFILTDKKARARRAEAADALAVLQALAVDKFRFRMQLREATSQRLRCFLEILSPQRTRGLRAITGVEVALNTPRLRTAILARSIVCPGATALLLNLIYSAPEHHVAHGKASSIPWIAEYAAGLQHLLFPVCLPRYFEGLRYRYAAEKLYQHSHVVLIGLYDDSAATHGRRRIRLCPFGESLRRHDIGFLTAPSASAAKLAVDSLEHRLQVQSPRPRRRWSGRGKGGRGGVPAAGAGAGAPPLSTLVFSSDTVLNRQSFADARSHSIRMEEDDRNDVPRAADDDDDDARTSDADEEESVHSVSTLPLFASTNAPVAPTARRMLRVHSDSWIGASASTSTPDPHRLRRQQTVPALRRSASSLDGGSRRRLRDHVIICGPIAQGHQLAWYLDTLFSHESSAGSGSRPTVVLLVKSLPTEDELAAVFLRPLPPDCFLDKGVSQNVEDLLRVRAFDARAVLFVPGSWAFGADELGVDESAGDHLLDYQVIMSTLSLQTIQELRREHQLARRDGPEDRQEAAFPPAPVMSCSVVRSRDSIKYFAYKVSKDDHEHHEQASRRVSSRRDPLYDHHDHTHHEPRGLGAWSSLGVHAHHRHEMSALEAELLLPAEFAPAYAAGEVFVDSFLDTLLCQSFFNPYAIDLVRALTGDYYYYYYGDSLGSSTPSAHQEASRLDSGAGFEDTRDELFPHAVLSTATIARELSGEAFQTVFERALAQNVLVLAIYRHAEGGAGVGGRGNARPYVFTCPDGRGDHPVARGDTLHVLSRRCPPICIV